MPAITLAIANEKGGVAKTTTAIHLGHALALRGRRILVVDIDPQSNATTWIGVERPRAALANALMNASLAGEAIAPSCAAGVDILWSSRDTAGAGEDLRASSPSPAGALRRALRTITDRYDYVLIDCAPGLGIITLNGLCAAQGIIAPIDSGGMAMQGLTQLSRSVKDLVESDLIAKAVPITALVTRYDSRLSLARQVVEDIDSQEIPRFESVIRNGTKIAQAFSFEKTLFDLDPKDNVAADYVALAGEIDHA